VVWRIPVSWLAEVFQGRGNPPGGGNRDGRLNAQRTNVAASGVKQDMLPAEHDAVTGDVAGQDGVERGGDCVDAAWDLHEILGSFEGIAAPGDGLVSC